MIIRNCLMILSFFFLNASSIGCAEPYEVNVGPARLDISMRQVSTNSGKSLLGVHSLWWGVQDYLFDSKQGRLYPPVELLLKHVGGVVRYGGGVNEISWRACIGDVSSREASKVVDWAGPMRCRFGISEYLDVVSSIDVAETWFIANLVSDGHGDEAISTVAGEAASWATYVRDHAPSKTRYWELGNELERGKHRWDPSRIAQRASAVAKEIHRADSNANLVLPLIEYNAAGQPKRSVFNEKLLRSFNEPLTGVALHLYYDGFPGGPSIRTQLRTVQESADLVRRIKGKPAQVWITEHGRWPKGMPADLDWKKNWHMTNDIDGALSTADFLIGLSQIEDVAGAMVHGLRAGPWNVFENTRSGLKPSGVGMLLGLLGTTPRDIRLQTRTMSQNHSAYAGGYDIRGAAFLDKSGTLMSLWVVNRNDQPTRVDIDFQENDRRLEYLDGNALVCLETTPNAECDSENLKVVPFSSSQIRVNNLEKHIVLPAKSVVAVKFSLKGTQ